MKVAFFFFKQKTAYEMRISDWSSDVCSSDLAGGMERHLIEIVIVLAPIFGGPAPVEFVDRAIARLQKGVPCRHRLGIERRRPDLVVDLPPDHRRLMAVPRRPPYRDTAREIAHGNGRAEGGESGSREG